MFAIPLIVAGSIVAGIGGLVGGNYLYNINKCGEARCYSASSTETILAQRRHEAAVCSDRASTPQECLKASRER
jgi:hypothetical protein